MPTQLPKLPLADENFVSLWEEVSGNAVTFLKQKFGLETEKFFWQDAKGMTIRLNSTLGGKLPVISTTNHKDFLNVEAVLNGKDNLSNFPPTVNAFTIPAKNKKIQRQRLILLNHAPYSNVPAEKLGLTAEDWLNKSYRLRLAHECAHYETLRIFGGMKNHALDEILADTVGQIAAFGNFSAARQKIFFGLHGNKCDGRLTFYCREVQETEREKIYAAVDKALDLLEEKINRPQSYFERFSFLACNKIKFEL